jgi:hypothetical protein
MEYIVPSRSYEEYKKSGVWKCKDSPTGAHHWIISDHIWRCIYCDGIKQDRKLGAGLSKREIDTIFGYYSGKKNRVEAQRERRKREKDQKEG